MTTDIIRKEIIEKVKEYYIAYENEKEPFTPGKSKVSYSGRVWNENELINLIDSSLDFWLTYGKYSKQFEKKFSEYLGVKYSLFVNSGSSANLLAFFS